MPVFVAYYRRALPRFQKVRELIFGQLAIGKPRIVNTVLYEPHHPRYHDPAKLPWHVVPEISGGGVFMDIGCHTLDILDWLFGPIVAVNGQASNQLGAYGVEDGVAMSFAFGNGMLGTGIWNFDSFKRHDQVEVVGDQGRITFATFGDGLVHLSVGGFTVHWHATGERVPAGCRDGVAGCAKHTLDPYHHLKRWTFDNCLLTLKSDLGLK